MTSRLQTAILSGSNVRVSRLTQIEYSDESSVGRSDKSKKVIRESPEYVSAVGAVY